jgi:hypothetical protein
MYRLTMTKNRQFQVKYSRRTSIQKSINGKSMHRSIVCIKMYEKINYEHKHLTEKCLIE